MRRLLILSQLESHPLSADAVRQLAKILRESPVVKSISYVLNSPFALTNSLRQCRIDNEGAEMLLAATLTMPALEELE